MFMACSLLVINACSSNNGSNTPAMTESSEKTETGAAAEKKVTGDITVTYMKSGTYDLAAEELAGKMKDKGINATVASFPWVDLRQKNTNDLITASGNYDVMSGSYYLADVYSYFSPLKEYIDRDGFGDTLTEGLMEKSEHVDGEPIGIPYGADALGLMYRKDLFEQAGLELPKTWDEFQNALKVLDEKFSKDGIVAYVGGGVTDIPYVFMSRYAGKFINKDGKYELNPELSLEAIRIGMEDYKLGPKNITGMSGDEANAMFINGKAAVLEGWPSFVRVNADDAEKSAIEGKWAVAPYPEPGLVLLSLWQMYLPKESKNKDAAWEWMKNFASEENDKHYFETYGISPIYKSTYEDQDLMTKYGHYFPGVFANLKRAQNPPFSGEAQDFMTATLGDIFSGKLTPEKGIETINEKWKTLEVPASLMESAKRNNQIAD
ncbi:hypothetical protein SY83_13455 [Paenibacillus swuensis]|uniref:ABC transporter substrate-binding protein n=2 Tax=Paenibacillus swuensis TaxID=1178515 RepID=A0A172TJB1_9BACL|nr:hypothetical protein SY83_13455 [Paenibacillus swuensis]